jgi:hypothetical protein
VHQRRCAPLLRDQVHQRRCAPLLRDQVGTALSAACVQT